MANETKKPEAKKESTKPAADSKANDAKESAPKKEMTEKAKKVTMAIAAVKSKADYSKAPFPELKGKEFKVTKTVVKDGQKVSEQVELKGKDAQVRYYERVYNSLSSKIGKETEDAKHEKAVAILKPFFDSVKGETKEAKGKRQSASVYTVLEDVAKIYVSSNTGGRKKLTEEDAVEFEW